MDIFSIYFLMFLSILLGAAFAVAFVWAVKTNQFRDIEEPKYEMLRHND